MSKRSLKIGYVMQADSVDMSQVSGPRLHVLSVVRGLGERGHRVRTIAIQQGQTLWSNDLKTWQTCEFGLSKSQWFRKGESLVRGIQSRLHLPFFRLFDSYRFSDACLSALAQSEVLYERYGMLSYGGLLAAKRMRIPLILEVNGDLVEEYRQLGLRLSFAQWMVVHLITQLTFQWASHIVAVGETIKRRIVRRWRVDPARIRVVPNGADIELFTRAPELTHVRSRFALNGDPTVIFVGSFQPWHGVDLLLDAFRQVVGSGSDARLILVGDGPLRVEMERKARALDLGRHVVFTGPVEHSDVASLLTLSDVAVICHHSRAAEIVETPLKLFEYMAAGRAIIAPAVPNMARVIRDGENGLLVPPDDAAALAKAILNLLKNDALRYSIGQAARRDAIENHSWARAVSELESLMFEVLDQQHA